MYNKLYAAWNTCLLKNSMNFLLVTLFLSKNVLSIIIPFIP